MDNFFYAFGVPIPLNRSDRFTATRSSEGPGKGVSVFGAGSSSVADWPTALRIGAIGSGSQEIGVGVRLQLIPPRAARQFSPDSVPEPGPDELPVFESHGCVLVPTPEFVLRLKDNVKVSELELFSDKQGAHIVQEFGSREFVLRVKSEQPEHALHLANVYHTSGIADYAHPNFIRILERLAAPNDPLWPKQWALNNEGTSVGQSGADIHAVAAWTIHEGRPEALIAIIDEGVDEEHPDLKQKLRAPFDATQQKQSSQPNDWDAHGTCCAGIAGALSNNARGIAGVAPGCDLMGVRIGYHPQPNSRNWVTQDTWLAQGIDWASRNGAWVLSNSWGGGPPSDAILRAIVRAMTQGRNGKGCVVLFAAGNADGPVNYPAAHEQVIAVGATNEWDERKSKTSRDGEYWWGSNYGPQLDIMAPGVHITTTDISGAGRGYDLDSDYYDRFNGTSAATPHVAGVAALILSVKPDLTAAQVRDILLRSADPLGGAVPNDYTGYGRVNAYSALRMALRT